MGYAGWIKGGSQSAERNDRESELVRELLSLGAVLYCKVRYIVTWNVQHLLMSA